MKQDNTDYTEYIPFRVAKMLAKRGYYDTINASKCYVFYNQKGEQIAEPTDLPRVPWSSVEYWLMQEYDTYALVEPNDDKSIYFGSVYVPADPGGRYPEGKMPMRRRGRYGVYKTYEEAHASTLERAVKSVPVIEFTDDLPF